MKAIKSIMIVATTIATASVGGPLLANGLGEGRPFQFRSSNERLARTNQLELQELKKGGFFDTFGNGGGASGDTIINGDQINCTVSASTVGNDSSNGITGVTGSLTGVDTPNISSDSDGNTSTGGADGEGSVDSNQTNSGDVSADVDDNTISSDTDLDDFDSGDNDSDIDSNQSIDDTVLDSRVASSSACGDFVLN